MSMEIIVAGRLKPLEKRMTICMQNGMQAYVEMSDILREIRDERHYREDGFKTFETYCQKRWGWGRNYVNKQIAAAQVVLNLGTTVPNGITERQARELVPLSPEQQRQLATTIDFQTTGAAQVRDRVQEVIRAMRPRNADHSGQAPKSRSTKQTATLSDEMDFVRRLYRELGQRRKEADLARSKRSWNTDAICKLDLIKVLTWIENELQTYITGSSVNAREKAKKPPQSGNGKKHVNHKDQIRVDTVNPGTSQRVQ